MNNSADDTDIKNNCQVLEADKSKLTPNASSVSPNQTLTFQTLLNMALRLLLVVLTISGISYWHLMSQLASDTQAKLLGYITERGQREEAVFVLEQNNHELLRREFLEQFTNLDHRDAQVDFEDRFFQWSDQTIRNVPEAMQHDEFDTFHHPTTFVQPDVELNADFKTRLALSYDLVEQYGLGWQTNFLNTYISLPEGAVNVFVPGVDYGITAPTDYDVRSEEWVYLGDKQHNPARETLWTRIYRDLVMDKWVVSAETPIDDQNGRHLGTIGHDLVLDDLIERVIDDHLDGTYNLLIRKDGHIIAAPQMMDMIQAEAGQLTLQATGDEHTQRILSLAQNLSQATAVVHNTTDHEYLAIAQLKGPEWYLITVYPEKLLQAQALGNTWFLLGLGVASLMVEVLLLWVVLQRKIKAPLTAILGATQQITEGDFSVHLDTERQDELGQLATSFTQMTCQLKSAFADLEKQVIELEKSRAESSLLAAVVESSNDAIITKTLQGEITSWNETAEKLFGYSEAEALGQHILMLSPPDRIDEEQRIITSLKQGEAIEHFETIRLHKDQTPIDVSITVSPVKDSTGKIIGASQVARDIRERKRNQETILKKSQELEAALEELKTAQLQLVQSEKMSALGGLVAGVAHEINNPIGCIIGNVDATQEYINDLLKLLELYAEEWPQPSETIEEELDIIDLNFVKEDLPKLIHAMKDSGKRIKSISRSLRTFSRADTDQKQLFNLHDGIDSTVLILRHRLKSNETRPAIEVVTDYGKIPEVACFPGQLNQVFMNILANAIDAFDDANAGKTFAEIEAAPNVITIQTSCTETKVQIQIKDNGCGMTPETVSRIFEQGFTTKEVGKGTGLGMAIARQIVVDNHGGQLTFSSTVGEGSQFQIQLPFGE